MTIEVWADKYRPATLDDYVWRDAAMRQKIEEWVSAGIVPQHLMLTGRAGCGKTSLALLLIKAMAIPSPDFLRLNASSDEAHVEKLQYSIQNFAESYAFGPTDTKYVLLDEADNISKKGQGFLRAEVEKTNNRCRFIFTANYPGKIDPAIHSRCFELEFKVLHHDEFLFRAATILVSENVEADVEVLDAYVAATYPDLRKCINLLQGNVLAGKLRVLTARGTGVADFLLDALDMFRAGKFNDARKLVIAQAQPDEYPNIYRMFYQHPDLWGATEQQQDDALLIIRKGLVFHSQVADSEINLAATMCELCRIAAP